MECLLILKWKGGGGEGQKATDLLIDEGMYELYNGKIQNVECGMENEIKIVVELFS